MLGLLVDNIATGAKLINRMRNTWEYRQGGQKMDEKQLNDNEKVTPRKLRPYVPPAIAEETELPFYSMKCNQNPFPQQCTIINPIQSS